MSELVEIERERRVRELVRGLGRALEDVNERRAHSVIEAVLEGKDNGMEELPMTLRVPKDVVERSDALVARLVELPEFRAMRVSRASALRMILYSGLDSLEAKYGKSETSEDAKKKKPAKPKKAGPVLLSERFEK